MQDPNEFLGKKIWIGPCFEPMAEPTKIDRDTARRLQILRAYAGCADSQTRFAHQYGFTVKQWNNFERGFSLPRDAAIQLVQKFPGLTLDWLHLGKVDGMPGVLRTELEAAEKATTSAEGKTRSR